MILNHNLAALAVLAIAAGATTLSANAATIPFLEDFPTDAADWHDAIGFTDVDWSESGGPDGSSHAATTFNFQNSVEDDTPAVFRGHDEYGAAGSSGGAFVGNWIDEGVGAFRMSIRHNAPFPITIFTRFAGPNNFPAGVAVNFVPVFPGAWTEITIPIDPDNPQFVTFEGADFQSAFSNIGHIQIGAIVDEALAGFPVDVRFDLDKVAIDPPPDVAQPVPAAGAVATVGLAAIVALSAVAGLRRQRTAAA
jgi:hypothetical protein